MDKCVLTSEWCVHMRMPYDGYSLGQYHRMTILTMAILTMAILTMARVTMAILTMA